MSESLRLLRVFCRSGLQAILTAVGIVVADFFLLHMVPGDAADVLAGESGSATVETVAALRHRFGLDLTLLQQFFAYIDHLAHLNLGFSPRYNMAVGDLIAQRLENSLLLMVTGFAFALILGIAIGTLMASFAGRLPDRIFSVLVLVFYSTPGFWIGLMMIVLFSVKLGWLPPGGSETIGAELSGFPALLDKLHYLVLPATSLALFYVAIYARLTRGAMLEVYGQDYVRTAVAKGLSPFSITIHHVLRNALIPVTTVAGMHIGGLLGGSVVVETVYSWPGLGRLAFDSVMSRDFSVLLGILLLSSLTVIVANMLVDVLQAWLDPRVDAR